MVDVPLFYLMASITGDGIKSRIREKLLTDTNLHTIIRLPQSTFFPAQVSTTCCFLKKEVKQKTFGITNTNCPKDKKAILKTKPIQFAEFQPIIEWWYNREGERPSLESED